MYNMRLKRLCKGSQYLSALSNRSLLSNMDQRELSALLDASSTTGQSSGFNEGSRPAAPPVPESKQPRRTRKRRRISKSVFTTIAAFFKQLWCSTCALSQRFTQQCARFWAKSWTAEACSLVLSVLTFAGLVATLLAHQNKPNPKWPQLVTINSIILLFSLLMRAAVSLVLAEGEWPLSFSQLYCLTVVGISQSKWQWYLQSRCLNDMAQFDSASRGPWGSFLMLCSLRPNRA
jgi:hypothetical protein